MTLPLRRSFGVGGFQSLSPDVCGTRDQGRAPKMTEPEDGCRSQLSRRVSALCLRKSCGSPGGAAPPTHPTPPPAPGRHWAAARGTRRAPRQGRMRGEPMWRTEAMGEGSRKSRSCWGGGSGGLWAGQGARGRRGPRGRGSGEEAHGAKPQEVLGAAAREGSGLRCISGPVCPGPPAPVSGN